MRVGDGWPSKCLDKRRERRRLQSASDPRRGARTVRADDRAVGEPARKQDVIDVDMCTPSGTAMRWVVKDEDLAMLVGPACAHRQM